MYCIYDYSHIFSKHWNYIIIYNCIINMYVYVILIIQCIDIILCSVVFYTIHKTTYFKFNCPTLDGLWNHDAHIHNYYVKPYKSQITCTLGKNFIMVYARALLASHVAAIPTQTIISQIIWNFKFMNYSSTYQNYRTKV